MNSFLCSGTKGDVIMSLYVMKALGGGNLYITKGEFEESDLESVIESCGRLVSSQKYVHLFKVHNGEPINISLDKWRRSLYLYRKTILELMCEAQGLELTYPVKPWIDVPPHPDFLNKIVVHRRISKVATRANPMFDWKCFINTFGPENFVFVSRLKYEWEEFGFPEVEYYCPSDMYEHAQTIKACRFFIGNQSLPSAIADALGVNRVFELAVGAERNHFAVEYADNAWYFASPWKSTLKNFRYVKIPGEQRYLDLLNMEKIEEIEEELPESVLASMVNEIKFRYRHARCVIKRHCKFLLGVAPFDQ